MFLHIVGWAENALRLSWGGEKTYSGYLVEQLQPDKKWRKIVWIGDGKLTSCRIENLEPSREYRFRMTPFQFDKNYHEQYMMDRGCRENSSGNDFCFSWQAFM